LIGAALLVASVAFPGVSHAVAIPFGSGTAVLTQSGTSVNFDVALNFGNRFIESISGGGKLFLFNDSLPGSTITNVTATPNKPAGNLTGSTNLAPVSTVAGSFTASVECTVATECDGASPHRT